LHPDSGWLERFPIHLEVSADWLSSLQSKTGPWLALDRASLDILKVGLRVEPKVHKIIALLWSRLPGNLTVGVCVPHCMSGRFEFSQDECRDQLTGCVDGITPEAGGFSSLIGAR
jgi:hypothetical protein